MVTIEKPAMAKPQTTERQAQRIPPLQNGDRLTRAEFERRYSAMPEVKKAELIEGIVYVPSPVSLLEHAGPHFDVITWLGIYKAMTPCILGGDNGTLRLDVDNEPQPDAFLLIDPKCGGQARISSDGYVEGAPELVVEVAASSISIDTHTKLNVYRRNGVSEYVIWRVQDHKVDWFRLREGEYEPLQPDSEGMYRSEVLPGLLLDPSALVAGDLRRVIEIQTAALQSDSYATFVNTLSRITK